MLFESQPTAETSVNGSAKLSWHRPVCTELPPDEEAEIRAQIERGEGGADDVPKRGRGRPPKKRRYTPCRTPFDDITAGIRAIPKEGGAWFRAKETAKTAIAADKDLRLRSLGHPVHVRHP